MSGAENNLTILTNWARDLVSAVGFLTRLPVARLLPSRDTDPAPKLLADVAWAFPLVGVIVGVVAAAALMVSSSFGLHPLASALIALAVAAAVTGALHEDGLADLADGFGGGADTAAKLAIMRDSHVGTYGMLALIFSVGIRAAALAGMPGAGTAAMSLITAACVSRALVVGVMSGLPAARDDGLGRGAGKPETGTFLTALAIAAVAAFVFSGAVAWVLLAIGGAATAAMMWLARRQIGGQTGDVLGATQQVCEMVILLAAAAVLG